MQYKELDHKLAMISLNILLKQYINAQIEFKLVLLNI